MSVGRAAQRRSSRQRMVDSAVTLLRERGAAGTTIDAVLAHSGAPRGSVYHHFPGGRREMLAAAVTRAGEAISGLLRAGAAGTAPEAVLREFARLWRGSLVESGYRAGCPVLALVVDEGLDDEELSALAGEILARWRAEIAEALAGAGIAPARAGRLAALVLAAVEGALVLCRGERSADPLDTVVEELAPLLARDG